MSEFVSQLSHNVAGFGHRDNLHKAKELSALFNGTKVMLHGLPCEDTDPGY